MGRDKSMSGRTPKWVDKRAQRNVRDDNYNPPFSWFPFTRERVGTEARDRYDRAYKHHRNKKD